MAGEARPAEPFWYQRLFVGGGFALDGFLALGASVSAIRNALFLVNPLTTYIGTAFIILAAAIASLHLRRHPLPWIVGGRRTFVTRLGVRPILMLAGACLLLWVPRLIANSKTGAFREPALESTRGNLARLHRRLKELHETVAQIGTKAAPARLRSLPDRIVMLGNPDMSFCRSLEFQMADLEPGFARAGRAYCGAISNFAEAEAAGWSAVKEHANAQDVLRRADEIEAQLALACLLTVPEAFYIQRFDMVLRPAQGMGLSERDLLTGSRELALPDIPTPTPYIAGYIRSRFRIDCGTGKILR